MRRALRAPKRPKVFTFRRYPDFIIIRKRYAQESEATQTEDREEGEEEEQAHVCSDWKRRHASTSGQPPEEAQKAEGDRCQVGDDGVYQKVCCCAVGPME